MTEDEFKDAIAAMQGEIDALKDTNKQLKTEKTAAAKAAKDAQDLADQAAQDAAEKSGNVEAIKKGINDAHAKEMQKKDDAIFALNKSLEKLTVDDAISGAIAKAGVPPQHVRAMTLMMRDGVVFENGNATRDGVALGDALTAFLASNEAAPYLPGSGSSGAGARGSTTPTAAAPNTLDALMQAHRNGTMHSADINAAVTGVQSPSR